jgi:hypothetical protein
VNPHFGQRYGLPNFRHFEQRHMIISPQFGHGNFVASVVGAMILWHDVHVGMVVVVCSVTVDSSWNVRYNASLFICAVFLCVRMFAALFVLFFLLLDPL